jgi:hypothetical protein
MSVMGMEASEDPEAQQLYEKLTKEAFEKTGFGN